MWDPKNGQQNNCRSKRLWARINVTWLVLTAVGTDRMLDQSVGWNITFEGSTNCPHYTRISLYEVSLIFTARVHRAISEFSKQLRSCLYLSKRELSFRIDTWRWISKSRLDTTGAKSDNLKRGHSFWGPFSDPGEDDQWYLSISSWEYLLLEVALWGWGIIWIFGMVKLKIRVVCQWIISGFYVMTQIRWPGSPRSVFGNQNPFSTFSCASLDCIYTILFAFSSLLFTHCLQFISLDYTYRTMWPIFGRSLWCFLLGCWNIFIWTQVSITDSGCFMGASSNTLNSTA